jgi:hypothetical protein
LASGGTVTTRLEMVDVNFKKTFDDSVNHIINTAHKLNGINITIDKLIARSMTKSENVVKNSVSTMNNLLHSVGMAVVKPKVSSNIADDIKRQVAEAKASLASMNRQYDGLIKTVGQSTSIKINQSAVTSLITILDKITSLKNNLGQTTSVRINQSALTSLKVNLEKISTIPFLNKLSTNASTAMSRTNGIVSTGVSVIKNNLISLNSVSFTGMVSKFKGAMTAMVSSAQAGAAQIRTRIVEGLSATDYMATIFGSMIGSQVWEKGYGKATMQQQMMNKYGPTKSQGYVDQYQKYTIKSSTSDAEITKLMKYVTQSGLESDKTYSALSAIDAAATTSDPTQRYELLRNFGNYLTNGYTEAAFRGDVTKAEADTLKGAQTPEQRILAMEQVAKGRGNMNPDGSNLSTTTTGPVGAYNAVLVSWDTIMRGLTLAFTNFLMLIKPVFTWFNNLSVSTQNFLGAVLLLVGGITLTISVLGILVNLFMPLATIMWTMTGPMIMNALGFNANAVAALGYSSILRILTLSTIANMLATEGLASWQIFEIMTRQGLISTIVATLLVRSSDTLATDANTVANVANGITRYGVITSLIAYIIAEDVAIVSRYGALTSIFAYIAGEKIATFANMTLTQSIWAVTSALLKSPYFWVAVAIIGIVYAVYEVGKAFGWWTSIMEAGKAIWAGLQRVWSSFVNNPMIVNFVNTIKSAFQGLWIALSPIGAAFSMVWNAIFPNNQPGGAGNFDIVASIINFFGQLGNTIAWLFGVIQSNPILNTLFTALLFIINPIYAVIYAFEQLGQFFGLWDSWGQMFTVVGGAIASVLNWIGGAIQNTFGFIVNSFFKGGEFQGVLGGIWNILVGIGVQFGIL